MNAIFTQNTERPALRKQPALRVWLQLCMLVLAFCVGLNGHAQTVTYIHTDGLGSPVAKSDASGNLVPNSRTRYEPYGMEVAGTATPTIGFTGHVNDADTGLTYMQQRYYDPVAGRFLSTDPVLTDVNTAGSFNRYTYALNNPYRYVDPDGRQALALCFGGPAACGAAILLTAATVLAAKNAVEKTPEVMESIGRDKTREVPVATSEKALERKDAYVVRVQAQGTSLKNETSVPLTASAPIPVTAVQAALQGTAAHLTPKEQVALAPAFAAASAWANKVAAGGGIGPIGSTTFNVPGFKGSQARVDIEILKGHNIVP